MLFVFVVFCVFVRCVRVRARARDISFFARFRAVSLALCAVFQSPPHEVMPPSCIGGLDLLVVPLEGLPVCCVDWLCCILWAVPVGYRSDLG